MSWAQERLPSRGHYGHVALAEVSSDDNRFMEEAHPAHNIWTSDEGTVAARDKLLDARKPQNARKYHPKFKKPQDRSNHIVLTRVGTYM